jgi:hypothetical protein
LGFSGVYLYDIALLELCLFFYYTAPLSFVVFLVGVGRLCSRKYHPRYYITAFLMLSGVVTWQGVDAPTNGVTDALIVNDPSINVD